MFLFLGTSTNNAGPTNETSNSSDQITKLKTFGMNQSQLPFKTWRSSESTSNPAS